MSRTRLIVGLAVFAGALTLAILRVTTLSQLVGVRLSMPLPLNDFKAAVYCPVIAFARGANPYDRRQLVDYCPIEVYCRGSRVTRIESPSDRQEALKSCKSGDVFPPYAPAILPLHLPVALLPIDAAALVYFLWSVGLSLAVVAIGLRLAGARVEPPAVLLGTGLLLLTRPGQLNLLLGQVALEMTLATYVALYSSRQSPRLSGLALAIAAYKPTFGLPLAVLMLARGSWRAVLWGGAFAALLNLPPAIVLLRRSGGVVPFLQSLADSQAASRAFLDSTASRVFSVDLPGLVSRWMGGWISGIGYAVLSLAVLAVAARAPRALPAEDRGPAANLWASVACLGILASVHHNVYDLVLLVAPVVFLVRGSLPEYFLAHHRRYALLGIFALLGANYVTTLAVLHRLEPYRAAWLVLASLNGALLLAAFLMYVAGATAHSSRQTAAVRDRPGAGAVVARLQGRPAS
jgi:hypothetical protein